ncbi:hypothetical protein J437_LFUL005731 [Ladona fulva]|uniref:Major facilitator superfamily (MFS) profile domain-containing protein n=1 Tax=Ladona fulva TaxID=123851 RepID=A0A8K0NXX2_LADFU|nr:hypothetical protein J437_LFUL005731 [Ladona fulva]
MEEIKGATMNKEDDCESGSKIRCNGNRIPARVVLGILSFFAFFTNYMLRVNLSIAIVAMVKEDNSSATIVSRNLSSETESFSSEGDACFRSQQLETNSSEEYLNSFDSTEIGEQFEWDSMQQGILLGAFYWTYVMSGVPGAILARRFGTKFIYGAANGISAIFTLMTPFAARTSFTLLIIVRLIEGFFSGMTWPAMHTMASQWIPPHERSTFVTTYMGNAVGTAFTYPLCGILIDKYGWPSAFYVPGFLTLIWCFFWWILVYDSPNSHPRITKEEKQYIEDAVSPTLHKKKLPVPWLEIAKSAPFWSLAFANFSVLWAFMIVIQYAPTYLKTVHGFNIRAVSKIRKFRC